MNAKIIAVEDGGAECGLITGWSLTGAVEHAALTAAWQAAGLDMALLPSIPSMEAALGRAVKAIGGKGVRLENLPDDEGWAIVDVSFRGGLPVYNPRMIARLEGVIDGVVVSDLNGSTIYTPDADKIRNAYQVIRRELSTTDLSAFLSRLVTLCDGVGVLRDGGGVYYVPPAHVATWRQMIGAIKAASRHQIGEIPAMRSDAAIATILAGLETEAMQAAATIQAQLEATIAGGEGSVGVRALAARSKLIAETNAKLARYAELFGKPAEVAVNALERLKQNLKWTVEYAEGKADGRDMDAPRLLDLSDSTPLPVTVDESAATRLAGVVAEVERGTTEERDAAHHAKHVERCATRRAAEGEMVDWLSLPGGGWVGRPMSR